MLSHDKSNKLLFSHRKMVHDLLTSGYIKGDWLKDAELETLERKFSSYVSADLRERFDDLVWRVRWKGGRWLYVYLLLEFQSAVDPIMAIRIMIYVGLLYQDLVSAGEVDPDDLPPVLPIVLYNGTALWTASLDVDGLLAQSPPGVELFRPQSRYLLLDEQRPDAQSPDVQDPAPIRNLVAALFAMERSRTRADIVRVLDSLGELLSDPALAGLSADLLTWLKRVLLPARVPNIEIPEVNNIQEMRTMLAERVQEWVAPWVEEARQETVQRDILDALEARFVTVPAAVRESVRYTKDEARLRELFRLAVTAQAIEEFEAKLA